MARSGNALRSGRVRDVRGRSSEERKREREDMQNLLCQRRKPQYKYIHAQNMYYYNLVANICNLVITAKFCIP